MFLAGTSLDISGNLEVAVMGRAKGSPNLSQWSPNFAAHSTHSGSIEKSRCSSHTPHPNISEYPRVGTRHSLFFEEPN